MYLNLVSPDNLTISLEQSVHICHLSSELFIKPITVQSFWYVIKSILYHHNGSHAQSMNLASLSTSAAPARIMQGALLCGLLMAGCGFRPRADAHFVGHALGKGLQPGVPQRLIGCHALAWIHHQQLPLHTHYTPPVKTAFKGSSIESRQINQI